MGARASRKFLAVAAATATVALSMAACSSQAGAAATPAGAYRANDAADGKTLYILPAGENGLVNSTQLSAFFASGARPPGSDDQLSPYQALIYGNESLTDSELGSYFEDESFGVAPQSVTRTERPSSRVPVTILRDTHDLPHIYGRTMDSMAFGAGYAAAEDRLFFMDVLRHYARGDLTGFLGPSCSYEQMDHDQLLLAGYSDNQLNQQLEQLPHRFGPLGGETVSMIGSYVAGVNAYIDAARSDPAKLPADYAVVPGGPQPWRATDVVAITSLITTQATGGGDEVKNAALLRYLQSQLGSGPGETAFADFKEQNDPAAPTTITDRSFPYMIPGKTNPALTAIPDNPAAPLAGGPVDTTSGCTGGAASSGGSSSLGSQAGTSAALAAGVRADVAAALAAVAVGRGADSNALVVGASDSASGHPMAVFGPELGYYAPQVLMVEDLHGPGYDAEGAAFPGTNLVVQLGRGRNYAWSATTASTDQIDQRVELVCDPRGAPPQPQGKYYLYKGHCLAMGHLQLPENLPEGSQGPGSSLEHDIYTTVHGIVQGWTTVGGKPVAIADQRSTFANDVDSLVGFLQWGEPSLSSTPDGWMTGAGAIPYSFNWFYVNGTDIAYYVSGRDPLRPANVAPNLPTWGTGQAEWRGLLAFADHPHQVDPSKGYFVSWNNKPAPGFSASDDNYGFGPVFRSQLIDSELRHQLAVHRHLTRANVVQAVESAATMDLSSYSIAADLRSYLGRVSDPAAASLLDEVAPWAASGAHRVKASEGSAQYTTPAAVAIWDESYPRIVEALFSRLFGAGGVQTYNGLPYSYAIVPMAFENTPNDKGAHDGDGYYGGWDGYVLKALDQLQGKKVAAPLSPAVLSQLCGAGGESSCRSSLVSALDAAYRSLVTANGNGDVTTWTQNTATVAGGVPTMPQYDQIEFQSVGIVGQPAMEWQNRPTFQQVAEFPG